MEDETDYGVQLFEHVAAAVRHRFPGEHLDRIFAGLDPKEFPNMHFVRKDYVRLNVGEALLRSAQADADGIELEQPKVAGSSAKKR